MITTRKSISIAMAHATLVEFSTLSSIQGEITEWAYAIREDGRFQIVHDTHTYSVNRAQLETALIGHLGLGDLVNLAITGRRVIL